MPASQPVVDDIQNRIAQLMKHLTAVQLHGKTPGTGDQRAGMSRKERLRGRRLMCILEALNRIMAPDTETATNDLLGPLETDRTSNGPNTRCGLPTVLHSHSSSTFTGRKTSVKHHPNTVFSGFGIDVYHIYQKYHNESLTLR